MVRPGPWLVVAVGLVLVAACGDNIPEAPPDAAIPDPDAVPPDAELPPENCDNDLDDDGDHVVDCGDPDCMLEEHCQPEMACNDDEDNDRDGDTDCNDSDCAAAINCLPEGLCSNGADDDLDGDMDCADDDCELMCLAGCSDSEQLVILPATGLPQPVDTTDVVVDFPVTMAGFVRGIAIRFTIQHTFPGDLDISMRSPDGGTSVDLSSDNGATGMNYIDTTISDEASTPITSGSAPFTGVFLPEESLTRVMGLPSLGSWQLVVHDDFAGETGSVDVAELYLCVCDGNAGCEQHRACLDGEDNDGDTLVDCLDVADCGSIPQCTPETMCSDDLDNNLDGQTDCQDPDCNGIDGCENPEVSCTDGLDNDQNGDPDCADPDCAATAHCLPEADCTDGTDDDGDGLADCLDVGCDGVDGCELGTELSCQDGLDNDGDTVADCADADCSGLLICNGIACPAGSVPTNRSATDLPQAILSNTTIESTIDVEQLGLVRLVAVRVDLTHTFDGDIDMFLDAPGGTVELSTDNGSTNENYLGTIFLDAAATAITAGTAPYTGQFRPEGTLGTLISQPVEGDWTLRIADDAGGDEGNLFGFQVLICHCDATSGDCEFGFACRNGTDDDGDAIVDCAEASCATDPFCIPEAICDDDIDQDLDGLVDCLDPHCNGIAGCQFGTEAACTDNLDNDGDGGADCADTDCGATAHCLPEANCMDGLDDDGDGLVDCLDVGCNGMAGCELGTELTCNDGVDNDDDLAIDCADSDCANLLYCNTTCPTGMGTTYLAATDLPQPIPSPSTVPSVITVTDMGSVQKVVVKVDITHTWDSDLDLFLDAPGGTVELSTDNGSSLDNYTGTIFDDSAPTAVTAGTAPFAGRFRPEQPLGNLFGTALAGTWTFRAVDDLSGFDGVFNSYELLVCHCDPTSGNCEFGVSCRNGTDEDGDTLIDCADPNCATDPFCIPEAVCDDAVDNDLDGLIDCLDMNCNGVSGCEFGTEITCTDGINNDGDAQTDCFDSDCAGGPNCQIELVCNNGVDDDGNGFIDCLDPACAGGLWCSAEADCDDTLDNDGDGATDCADVGCDGIDGCVLADELACEDGIDNDADGLADCADGDCALWCAIPTCPAGTQKVLYQGASSPIAIPDGSPGNPVLSTIVPDVAGIVSEVAVRVDITHTDDGDIDMFLVTPIGDFELATDAGSGGDHFIQTVFVDSAAGQIGLTGFNTAPFTGSYRPEWPLVGLAGASASGAWTLQVADDLSTDTGTLDNYQLLFCQCDAASGDCELGAFACRNGVDDDGDGLIDCAEATCASDALCVATPPATEEVCNDGLDDDGDGSTDCTDTDCAWVCDALGSVCAAPRQLLRYGAQDLPQTVPTTDNFLTTSPFLVDRAGTIVRAAVRFNAAHTAAGHLVLTVGSPAGTILVMTDTNGSTGDNYINTVFVDTAPGQIGTTGFTTAPFTGNYRPQEPLSLLAFENPLGLWWAQLRDVTVNDGGTWQEASLGLCIIP